MLTRVERYKEGTCPNTFYQSRHKRKMWNHVCVNVGAKEGLVDDGI